MLVHRSINDFLTALSSDSPAPGGGSVAAFSGTLGAALLSMVCRLTLTGKGYEAAASEINCVLAESERLLALLTTLVDEDTSAYNQVTAALKLPKQTEEQKKCRHKALQDAFKRAAEVPLQTARACLEVLKLIHGIVPKANRNTVSDMGVAAKMAHAGVEGAVMNVLINLKAIRDSLFVEKNRQEIAAVRDAAAQRERDIDRYIQEELTGGVHGTLETRRSGS